MNQAQQRDEAVFEASLQLSADQRGAYLDKECAGDAELRRRVEALLGAFERAGGFLKEPATPARTARFSLPPTEKPGDRIGRYKLLEQIGEGGCGVVYVAEQEEPVRRRVALKVIKLGMDTKQVIARFDAERQALAMMDHPNIAKVLDASATETGRPYFVMELVRGIRITDYCDQNQLGTRERLDLFIKVCQAIQHAHQKGIIHRDIKPSNILVTVNDGLPIPKVIDFGIAKATQGRLTDQTIYTAFEQFIGTPAYMSPEQAEMTSLDIDTRSDIYSLGVLLYELLAGSTPFDAKELMASGIDAMRKTIREKEPQRPSTKLATLQGDELTKTAKRRSVETSKLANLLKGDLDWIVMKCLEKDRQRRYETANGLAADLKRHLNNEPVVARPPTAAYKFQKAFRRNKLVFAAVTAVVAALLFGVIASTWQATVATRAKNQATRAEAGKAEEARKAQDERDNAKAAETQAQTARTLAETARQQSRRLLYAADMNLAQQSLKQNNLGLVHRLLDRHRPQPGEEDLRGWEWRYLWQLTRSSALVTLTNRPVSGFEVSFSPDGSRLAVGWWDGPMDLWDVPGRRRIRTLTDMTPGSAACVAFSPVGNVLAATSEHGKVTLYDLDSGKDLVFESATAQSVWRVRDLSFSPDGSRLVIYAGTTSGKKQGEVSVVNVATSKIEHRYPTLFYGAVFFGVARLSPDNGRLYLARSDQSAQRYSIQCLDAASSTEIWQTETQRDSGLTALAISPDGRMLVSGSGYTDPTLRVWDAATGRLVRQIDGHTAWVSQLVFSKDGRQLISSATDQTIRFWDTATWTETKVLRGHSDEVQGLAISETAQLVASTGRDGDLKLWNLDETGAANGYRRLPEDLSPSKLLPLDHSRVLLLPPGKPPELGDLRRDAPPTLLTEIATSGNVLGWFGTNLLCYWNGTNRILVGELRGTESIQRGAITLDSGRRPDGVACNMARQLLAWSEPSSTNSVFLANFVTPDRRVELKGDVPGLVPRLFSDDGNFLVAWTPDGNSLRAWNIETGQIAASIQEHVEDATLAAGGRVLVAIHPGKLAHEVAFYDLAHPQRLPRRVPGRHYAIHLAVSPDGGLVATATEGGEVRLFDPVKGELLESLHGHLNGAFGVAFSPDGRRLISTNGGRDAVKLWDVGTRQELLTLGGNGTLFDANWSADGDTILAGSPWQAWRAPSWEAISAAEAKEKAEAKQP